MIADGDSDAFAVFYERHHRGLLSFCRHTLGSREEAEDAVQHTFLAAYRQLGEHERTLEAPRAWLYTVARNRCLSVLRARREHGRESAEPATAGLAEEVQRRADLRDLLSDVAALPEDQRSALILSELGDLSHDEIAGILDRPTPQIKSLVFRARSALIEDRTARDTTCADIREQLSTLTGGSLRRGPLRRHLKACSGCADFREQVRRQRAALGIVLPVVPTIGLQDTLAAASGAGGASTAGVGAAGGSGGAGLAGVGAGGAATPVLGASAGSTKIFAGLALKAGTLKTVAVVAATGTVAAGGGVAVERAGDAGPRPTSDSRAGVLVQGADPPAPTEGGPGSGPANEQSPKAGGRPGGSSAARGRRDAATHERRAGGSPGRREGRSHGRSSRAASPGRGHGNGRVAQGRAKPRDGAGGGAPAKQARPERTRPDGKAGGRPASPADTAPNPAPTQRPQSAAEPGGAAARGRTGPLPLKPRRDSSS